MFAEKYFSTFTFMNGKGIINVNELLSSIMAAGSSNLNYRKLSFLLRGNVDGFTKEDIRLVRKCIKQSLTDTDNMLAKLETKIK